MSELKSCPFCGQTPEVNKSWRYPGNSSGIIGYTIVCWNTDCIMRGMDNWYRRSEKAAIKAWNTRHREEL